MKKKIIRYLIISHLTFILSIGGMAVAFYYYHTAQMAQIKNANILLISKDEMKLRLIDYKGQELFTADIACGKNYGNKEKQGDLKTPEGTFKIIDIQDASKWKHDFGDGKGEIEGAYGNHFIRLETPGHKGIGIHVTHDPLSIGTQATEGCIRIKNPELEQLVSLIRVPTTVIITPAVKDIKPSK